MARTEAQRAADDALTAAIEQMRAAYVDDAASGEVLTDYVVVHVAQGWDDDGDSYTVTGVHHRDAAMPLYRIAGLLHYATVGTDQRIAEPSEADED